MPLYWSCINRWKHQSQHTLFSTIQTPRSGVKKEGAAMCFKTNFRFSGCHRWLKHWKWFSSFSLHELLFNQWLSHKNLCFVLQTLVFQDNDFEVSNKIWNRNLYFRLLAQTVHPVGDNLSRSPDCILHPQSLC